MPGRARLKARGGSVIRPRLGAASPASPVKLGPDRGRRRREGGSLHQGRRQQPAPPPPCSPLGAVWQLSLGGPGDLGETPLCDLSGASCTVSAHPRRSGALLPPESKRGTREEKSAPGAGYPAAGARGPLERPRAPLPRNNHERGLTEAGGLCQLDPAAGRVDTRGPLPWGPFPLRQESSLRPAAA